MRKHLHSDLTLLTVVLFVLLLGSCASKSARFYSLNPVMSPSSHVSAVQERSSSDPRPSIGIVLVEIPDYLDRPQIVTRNASNEIELAEFDRWAGELQKDVARVLAETMSAALPEDSVFVLTGRRAVPADYRITVQIARFDPMPDNVVWLKAMWTVLGKDPSHIAIRGESNLTEPIQGTGYGATVAAMSRAIDKLGTEIAGVMKPMLARNASTYSAEATR
jgi:uncharacterized lipoprotein YmbA